jgi:hypothetical protein
MVRRIGWFLGCWLSWVAAAAAGIHEKPGDLPVGLMEPARLLDQLRALRGLGPPDPLMNMPDSDQRQALLAQISELRARRANLHADELAQLGAYLVRVRKTELRLPDYQEALQVLEAAQRAHPRHFAILANLGTAYQLNGMPDAAERLLEQAVAVAPPAWQRFEAFHLRLVQARLREPRRAGPVALDFLFNRSLREPPLFLDPETPWRVAHLSTRDRQLLPQQSLQEATLLVQQLLLWLPDDGRLHWLYGELVNAAGQPRPALEALTLAVDLFRLSAPELRQRRLWLREYVNWQGLLERVGAPPEQRLWLVRTAGTSFTAVALAQPLTAIDSWAPLTRVRNLLEGMRSGPGPAEPPAAFDWSQVSWPAVALGGAVIGLFLLLQLREMVRRRSRARRS